MKNKVRRIVVVSLILVMLLIIITSYIRHQNNMNTKVSATQVAYYALKIPDTTQYTEEEKQEFERLMEERSIAFDELNVSRLLELNIAFDVLERSITKRIDDEILAEKYDALVVELEKIELLPEANSEEESLFYSKREKVLQMIEIRDSIEEIHTLMEELKKLNSDISERKRNEGGDKGGAQREIISPSYETSRDGQENVEDSEISTPSQPVAPPVPAEQPDVPETCKTKPNGAVICIGGSW